MNCNGNNWCELMGGNYFSLSEERVSRNFHLELYMLLVTKIVSLQWLLKTRLRGYNNWRPLHCNKFYLRVFCAQFARNWRIILCCFSFHSTSKCIYPFFLNKRKFYWFGWICHVAFEKTIGNRDCMYPFSWIVVICWILNSFIFRS